MAILRELPFDFYMTQKSLFLDQLENGAPKSNNKVSKKNYKTNYALTRTCFILNPMDLDVD